MNYFDPMFIINKQSRSNVILHSNQNKSPTQDESSARMRHKDTLVIKSYVP